MITVCYCTLWCKTPRRWRLLRQDSVLVVPRMDKRGQKITLKYITDNKNGEIICINALEYVSLSITYLACTYCLLTSHKNYKYPYPTILLRGDNTTGKSWAINTTKNSLLGRLLGRIQCTPMVQNPISFNKTHVNTKDNVAPDQLSHIPSEAHLPSAFAKLQQDFPCLACCRSFQPSVEVTSLILGVLLDKKLIDPLVQNKLLFTNLARIITSDSAH